MAKDKTGVSNHRTKPRVISLNAYLEERVRAVAEMQQGVKYDFIPIVARFEPANDVQGVASDVMKPLVRPREGIRMFDVHEDSQEELVRQLGEEIHRDLRKQLALTSLGRPAPDGWEEEDKVRSRAGRAMERCSMSLLEC